MAAKCQVALLRPLSSWGAEPPPPLLLSGRPWVLHPALRSQLISGDAWLLALAALHPALSCLSPSGRPLPVLIWGWPAVCEADVGLKAPATSLVDPGTAEQTVRRVLIPDPELCALRQTGPAERVSHTSVASRSRRGVSSGARGSCELGSGERRAAKLRGTEE